MSNPSGLSPGLQCGLLLLQEEPRVLPRLPAPLADIEDHILRELARPFKTGCPLTALGGRLLRAFGPLVWLEVLRVEGRGAWVLVLTQALTFLGTWGRVPSQATVFSQVCTFLSQTHAEFSQ